MRGYVTALRSLWGRPGDSEYGGRGACPRLLGYFHELSKQSQRESLLP